MNLNISQLKERVVAAQFSDVEQLDDSIIRCTKKVGHNPFAVYYFDVGENLPSTKEQLIKYQDRIIGSRYFDGRKSLQWSNYLYFLSDDTKLSDENIRIAKELIELDRSYARKFVISEKELESIIAPNIVFPADKTPQENVLSVWSGILAEKGLDTIVLSDESIPTRLKLIEDSSVKSLIRTKTQIIQEKVPTAPVINSLELTRFREFPITRNFTFGSVNLLYGVNGSGKTSLLEAIELFYCGKNKRNPNLSSEYTFKAILADNTIETVNSSRSLQEFRDRNLLWYGQSEVRTNNLYQSFAQFNFLDTDAAVGLSDSTSRLEEDLSKLLVGPEASKAWKDIQRVNEAVTPQARSLNKQKVQIKEELDEIEKILNEIGDIKNESDSIHNRLKNMIERIGWDITDNDKELFASRLLEELSELLAITQQAAAIEWATTPLSIGGLKQYCLETKKICEKVEPEIIRIKELSKEQDKIKSDQKRFNKARDIISHIKELISIGLPDIVSDRNILLDTTSNYAIKLAGFEEVFFTTLLSPAYQDKIITALLEEISLSREEIEEALATAKNEYENFSKLRDESLNLSQELRQVATRIIENSPKPNECPLCHTAFEPGELAEHIKIGVDEHFEKLGKNILSDIQNAKDKKLELKVLDSASMWLSKFCQRWNHNQEVSVQTVLAEVKKVKSEQAEATTKLEKLNSEIAALEAQGFSLEKLENHTMELCDLGYNISELSIDTLTKLDLKIGHDSELITKGYKTKKTHIEELYEKLTKYLSLHGDSSLDDINSTVFKLKKNLAYTETLQDKLSFFSTSFPWPAEKPLDELVIETKSISKVASKLQAALGHEKQATNTSEELSKRRKLIEPKLEKLQNREKRLKIAQSVLERILNDHSLEAAMDSRLQQNRTSIESIFSRIHSPAEFQSLGPNWNSLIRKDGQQVKLSEISTGQRAAFALSVFLSQNAQIKAAPPVILIDDPIAHVDDLNSLSFLDYLRDIVLTGKRQIFFATANAKLATLFERKFDFLGAKEFRRYNLSR